MFRIILHHGYWEEIAAPGGDAIEVYGGNPGGQEVFHYRAGAPNAVLLVNAAGEQIRAASHTADPGDADGARFSVRQPPPGDKDVVTPASDLGAHPKLAAALLALDKGARLAPASMQSWLKAAEALGAAGRSPAAFEAADAALERGRLPHLKLLIKDDMSQKRMAAQVSFDAGRHEEGVAILIRLARHRLLLLEEAWK